MTNEITGEVLYQFLILKILIQNGGQAETRRIIDTILRDYRYLLSEKDMSDYEISKELRCENYIRFARQHLIEMGCLERNSPRGIWEITEKGRQTFSQWSDILRQGLSDKKVDSK